MRREQPPSVWNDGLASLEEQPLPAPDHTVSVVNIPRHGDGTDNVSDRALESLRNDVIPATIAKVPGVKVDVTGMTAGSKDFNSLRSKCV